MTTQDLGGPGREPVKVHRCDVVPEASSPSGYVARGLRTDGSIVRVPIPGATLDGVLLDLPGPERRRDLAPESSVWSPGEPKPAAGEIQAAEVAPRSLPAAAARRSTRAK